MMRLSLIVSLIAVLFLRCADEPLVFELQTFPLQEGNRWTYYSESIYADTSGNYFSNATSHWIVLNDTVLNGRAIQKVQILDTFSTSTQHTINYLELTASGLYGHGYRGDGSFIHLRETPFSEVPVWMQTKAESDTIIDPPQPYVLMQFPSQIGAYWRSYEYMPANPNFVRKWAGYDRISAASRTFDCIKLQLFLDTNNDGQPDQQGTLITQWLSTQGLIREEYIFTTSQGSFSRITQLTNTNVE